MNKALSDKYLEWGSAIVDNFDIDNFDTAIHCFDMAIIYDSEATDAYYWRAVAQDQVERKR